MAEQTKQRLDRTIELSTEAVLEQARQLATELHPSRKNFQHITLDSALDRDLGFDSLTRVELFQRLERAFGVKLPEQLLASAETPRDLWRTLVSAGATGREGVSSPVKPTIELEEMEGTPHAAETLSEMLDWHVLSHPQRPHVYLYGDEEEPEVITYAMLADGARTLATACSLGGCCPAKP